MRHNQIILTLVLLLFGPLFSQVQTPEIVRVDNDEIQTYRGISGKWIQMKKYNESFATLLQEFGISKEDFYRINELKEKEKLSQSVPYFFPFGDEYLKSIIARGMGRKYLKTDPRDFVLPVSAKFYNITSRMGKRWNVMHTGLDIACPTGSPVVAAADGTVKVSSFYGSYGNAIILQHEHLNKVQTIYGHNSLLLVREGETVVKGQIIALSGNTGHSTGPHLHFEVRYDTVVLNPEHYLTGMINNQTAVVAFENLKDFGLQ